MKFGFYTLLCGVSLMTEKDNAKKMTVSNKWSMYKAASPTHMNGSVVHTYIHTFISVKGNGENIINKTLMINVRS